MKYSELSTQSLMSLIPNSEDDARFRHCKAVHAEVLRRQRATMARLAMMAGLEDFAPYLAQRRN